MKRKIGERGRKDEAKMEGKTVKKSEERDSEGEGDRQTDRQRQRDTQRDRDRDNVWRRNDERLSDEDSRMPVSTNEGTPRT